MPAYLPHNATSFNLLHPLKSPPEPSISGGLCEGSCHQARTRFILTRERKTRPCMFGFIYGVYSDGWKQLNLSCLRLLPSLKRRLRVWNKIPHSLYPYPSTRQQWGGGRRERASRVRYRVFNHQHALNATTPCPANYSHFFVSTIYLDLLATVKVAAVASSAIYATLAMNLKQYLVSHFICQNYCSY